ncbi:MAG: isocitrate lyase/phosphoenolpyruvate mutase family protein [Bryobacterales bacterium]|nr:isocitrate lyase/phosphoenolpyruvate mutase family protein [Bryobacterales bacterium]
MDATIYAARRSTFRRLHERGCFALPNPWDVGAARYLKHLRFQALATTSAGLAFSLGLPDAAWAVPRDMVLSHIAGIVNAVDLPVNADFESGYAHNPEGVAQNVTLCVATGVAGLSIEDATGDSDHPLYDMSLAVERIQAARSAIDATATGVLLTARSECYLTGHEQAFEEAMRRLRAFAEAGADVLYAPGVRTLEQIRALVEAVAPKPFNLLIGGNTGLTLGDAGTLGVRRVSVGSALARAAWGGFLKAAQGLAREGSFAGFEGAAPFAELNAFFHEDLKHR